MNPDTAERWVVISAVTVAGVYGYRRYVGGGTTTASKNSLMGVGGVPNLGAFATAWGFTYLVVAAITQAAPGLGGAFAILIMAADLLTNTAELTKDITKQEGSAATAPAGTPTGATAVGSLAGGGLSAAGTVGAGVVGAVAPGVQKGAGSVAGGASTFLGGLGP